MADDAALDEAAALGAEASVAASRGNLRLALLLGLLPWPAVWLGLYRLHSAWAAFALYHAVCLGAWLAGRADLPALSGVLLRLRRRHWAALTLACLAVNCVVYLGAGLLAALLAPRHLGHTLAELGVRRTFLSQAALFAYFGLANPLFEELFWRQTVYARLRFGRWSPLYAALVSGALFGAWHWLPIHLLLPPSVAVLAVIGVATTGVLLALCYERVRSLPVVIVLHALGADVPILVALWVDVLSRR